MEPGVSCMADSTNKRVRLLTDVIREGGGEVVEVKRHKHLKIKFINPQGVTRTLITSVSPSDFRAHHDQLRILRRLMAEGPKLLVSAV